MLGIASYGRREWGLPEAAGTCFQLALEFLPPPEGS